MKPVYIIPQFDEYLENLGLNFSAIVVGGTALAIMEIIERETQDCDVLDPNIPDQIKKAAVNFAKEISAHGISLKENWLNNGPSSLIKDLPKDWKSRVQEIYSGKALKLYSLGRPEILKAKIFAFCDRELDRDDCIRLNPSKEELSEVKKWLILQDANPDWPKHVELSLTDLAKDLGYDF